MKILEMHKIFSIIFFLKEIKFENNNNIMEISRIS